MNIDWPLILSIIIPLVTLFLGAILNRYIERRAKLTTYMGHTSSFEVRPLDRPVLHVHTHSIVVTNVGGKAANNVRLSHNYLPDFYIFPGVPHRIEDLPQGGRDIVLPVLVPGLQITVSYLYYPPTTWHLVNSGVTSDEGLAKTLTVLPMRQFSKPVNYFFAYLMLIGIIATLYLLIVLSIKVFSRFV